MVIQPRIVAYNREFPPSKYKYTVHKTLKSIIFSVMKVYCRNISYKPTNVGCHEIYNKSL